MKSINGHELIHIFEQFSPKRYALEGDKIGLQVGRLNQPLRRVLIALDVTEEVVDEAITKDVQLIIAHHPLIYRPLMKIDTSTASGRIVEKLIKHDIAVYAAHTNLDVAVGGVNDLLADALGLQDQKVLVPTDQDELGKELGLGKIGKVPEMNLAEFAEHVKKALDVRAVRVVGNLEAKVKKVAVLGGDGNKYIHSARFQGADVYVTGDIYYHVAHDAMLLGLNLIDPGHNVEKVMKNGVAQKLTQMCESKGYDVIIEASTIHTDPFQFI